MMARWFAFTVWALAAASVVFWVLRMTARPLPLPATALPVVAGAPQGTPGSVLKLLGAAAAPTAVADAAGARFRLVGVIAPPPAAKSERSGSGGRRDGRSGAAAGVALIAVEGQPAKPYRVGQHVSPAWVLQAVEKRRALLGPSLDGPAELMLELPTKDGPPRR